MKRLKKIEDSRYTYWTENTIKCPNCEHEIFEEDINESAIHNKIIPEKASIFSKFDWDEVRIRCKLCKKVSPLKDWKVVEEHYQPLESGENPDQGETLVEVPLYLCPEENIKVRPLFAEMCKQCGARNGKDCTLEEE